MDINIATMLPAMATLFWAAVIIIITASCSRIATKTTRQILNKDSTPLPSSSIIVNIVRALIWIYGIGFMLSNCFGINVNGLFAALGVGGIAISLGLQDTIANLIGGVQMTFSGLVQPGDNIEIGGNRGVVSDVNWRHTTIVNTIGQTILIPNSVLSKTSLTHLPSGNSIAIPIAISASTEQPADLADTIVSVAKQAAETVTPLQSDPVLRFNEITPYGFNAKILLKIDSDDLSLVGITTDAVIRAVAPFTAHE